MKVRTRGEWRWRRWGGASDAGVRWQKGGCMRGCEVPGLRDTRIVAREEEVAEVIKCFRVGCQVLRLK